MLILNIGNTRIQSWEEGADQVAYFDTSAIVSAEDMARVLGDADQVKAACVVPRIREILEKAWPGRVKFVSAVSYPFLDFSAYDVTTLGADRMANAAAAYKLFGGPIAVIDCGTAINTEVVDADGCFRGGVILPGRALARRALANGTAQLPQLKKGDEMPPILGCNTAEAIAAGVDRTCRSGLRQFLIDVRVLPGLADVKFVITGGDAQFFQPYLENVAMAPDFLTLKGIALAE